SGEIIIENPQVLKTSLKGEVIFQISGNVKEKSYSDEDVKLVMEQSGIEDKEKVKRVLEESKGDVVQAIMKLKGS
ncbi:MAG: nascent polypeptide-associated complex protein, partial [Candidatus Hydrothermarchaeota archaeon]